MEKELNQHESLAIISSMIAGTKRKLSHDSVHYLLWGWSVLIAALAHYFLLHRGFEQPYLSWLLMPLTAIAAAIVGARQKRERHVSTHIDTAMQYVWIGFLIMLLLTLAVSPKIGFETSYPLLMWLYGLGTFISGGILKFKPLWIGGLLSFALGTAAFFLPFDQQLLLLAAAIIVSYIIPGHLLRRSKA